MQRWRKSRTRPAGARPEGDNIDSACAERFPRRPDAGPAPWLGLPVADLNALDRAAVISGFLRRTIRSWRSGCGRRRRRARKVSMLRSVDDDWLLRIEHKSIVAPSQLAALTPASWSRARAAGKTVPAALRISNPQSAKAVPQVSCRAEISNITVTTQQHAAASQCMRSRNCWRNSPARRWASDRGREYGRRISRRRGRRRGA
jgi:hypothetical protein